MKSRLFAQASLVLLVIPYAHAQGTSKATKQVETAIQDIDRLRAKGKLGEARARASRAAELDTKGVDDALLERLSMAQDAVLVAAGVRASRGEPCDFLTAEEAAARSPVQHAIDLLSGPVERLELCTRPALRELYLKDEAFAPLRALPVVRCILASTWGRPHLEVWPDLHLETNYPEFDATFDVHTRLTVEGRGEASPARAWVDGPGKQPQEPPEGWRDGWRCALISPREHGGFPVRSGILASPELRAATIDALRRKRAPWGFDALCLVNLELAAGDLESARARLARLRRKGGFLYDQAVDKALQLAQTLGRSDPRVRALVVELQGEGFGVSPVEAPPTAELAPARALIDEMNALRERGEVGAAWRLHHEKRPLLESLAPRLTPDLRDDLQVCENAAFTAASEAYARGEDCGWYSADELAAKDLAGLSRRGLAARVLLPRMVDICSGVPVAQFRDALMHDPALSFMRDTPFMRTELHAWGSASPERLWPGLRRLDTGDEQFDRLFAEALSLPSRPGTRSAAIDDWMKAGRARHRRLGETWAFRWRCALIAPYGEGGWPTRIGFLQDPAAVAGALRETESLDLPPAFGSLLLVNLRLCAGDYAGVRAAIAVLQPEGGILYAHGVVRAYMQAQNVETWPGRQGAALKDLKADLAQHMCGVAPPPDAR